MSSSSGHTRKRKRNTNYRLSKHGSVSSIPSPSPPSSTSLDDSPTFKYLRAPDSPVPDDFLPENAEKLAAEAAAEVYKTNLQNVTAWKMARHNMQQAYKDMKARENEIKLANQARNKKVEVSNDVKRMENARKLFEKVNKFVSTKSKKGGKNKKGGKTRKITRR